MKSNIQVRKFVLLAVIAILAVVLVLQLAVKGANHEYKLSLKGGIDTVTIQKGSNSPIKLMNNGGEWFLQEDENRPEAVVLANEDAVKQMTDFLSSVQVIGTVSRSLDDQRFGLADESTVVVTAERKGKTVRKIEIGKASVTYMQVYCRLDGKNDVVLVGGNPRVVFDRPLSDLKSVDGK